MFCFISTLNQWKVLQGNPNQHTVYPEEWGQRILWCRFPKQLGPELSRLVGKSLWDNSGCELRWSNRKPSTSWHFRSFAVYSAQPWERDGGTRSAHPLPHCRSAFQAWWSFSSRWQNTHIENSKATQGFCLSIGPGYDFFKSLERRKFAKKVPPTLHLETYLHCTPQRGWNSLQREKPQGKESLTNKLQRLGSTSSRC